MVWAKNTLDRNLLYTDSDASKQKIIILIADGTNTPLERQYDSGQTSADLDAETLLTCDEAKKEGIKIYAVNIINGDNDMLAQCSSSPDKVFVAASLDDIDDAFGDLSNAVMDNLLYISR
jgi:hypothetical protein